MNALSDEALSGGPELPARRAVQSDEDCHGCARDDAVLNGIYQTTLQNVRDLQICRATARLLHGSRCI